MVSLSSWYCWCIDNENQDVWKINPFFNKSEACPQDKENKHLLGALKTKIGYLLQGRVWRWSVHKIIMARESYGKYKLVHLAHSSGRCKNVYCSDIKYVGDDLCM